MRKTKPTVSETTFGHNFKIQTESTNSNSKRGLGTFSEPVQNELHNFRKQRQFVGKASPLDANQPRGTHTPLSSTPPPQSPSPIGPGRDEKNNNKGFKNIHIVPSISNIWLSNRGFSAHFLFLKFIVLSCVNSKREYAQQEEEEQAPHEKGGKCGPPGLVQFLSVVAN